MTDKPKFEGNFATAVMVYTMALAKALLPLKNLKERMTPEEADQVSIFIDNVITEAFDVQVAPMIRVAFNSELQAFKIILDSITNASHKTS